MLINVGKFTAVDRKLLEAFTLVEKDMTTSVVGHINQEKYDAFSVKNKCSIYWSAILAYGLIIHRDNIRGYIKDDTDLESIYEYSTIKENFDKKGFLIQPIIDVFYTSTEKVEEVEPTDLTPIKQNLNNNKCYFNSNPNGTLTWEAMECT